MLDKILMLLKSYFLSFRSLSKKSNYFFIEYIFIVFLFLFFLKLFLI